MSDITSYFHKKQEVHSTVKYVVLLTNCAFSWRKLKLSLLEHPLRGM